jgi:RNA polymerase sigma-70 factor (ECF subfamily)
MILAMDQTPQTLLEQLRHEPTAVAWKRLVDLYTPLIECWARQYSIPASDVDDLVQEVLAVLVRDLPAFEHNHQAGAFRCWLRTIVVHRVRGFWRARQAGARTAANGTDPDLLEKIADPASDPDRHWEQEHDQFIIRRALELMQPELTASTWQAFRRQVLEGAKPADVAAELGLSVNAVVLAKFRVMRRLRQELQGLID